MRALDFKLLFAQIGADPSGDAFATRRFASAMTRARCSRIKSQASHSSEQSERIGFSVDE
jgi:hypothetical protein